MTAPMYTLLILALLFANLPFLTTRAWGIFPVQHKKFMQHIVEMLVGFIIVAGLSYILEKRTGIVHSQGWEFFVVVICLYCVAAFPAFVWRYFWQGRNQE